MALNASLVGARTVMSCALLRVSPSFAAVTADTSVESTGLLDAAVATGSCDMPSKLPLPLSGTAEHAAPNGWSVIIASLPGDVAGAHGAAAPRLVFPAAGGGRQAPPRPGGH